MFTDEQILNFPNPEEYIIKLRQLGAEDLSLCSYKEIEDKYYNLCIVLPTVSIMTDIEEFGRINLYRARLKKAMGQNEDIDLIQTYSYPPTYVITSNGRANIKYKSVFYCSDNYLASIFECEPEIGDVGYLSLWKPKVIRSLKMTLYVSEKMSHNNNFTAMAKRAK